MEITQVSSPKDLKTFIDLTYQVYKNDADLGAAYAQRPCRSI